MTTETENGRQDPLREALVEARALIAADLAMLLHSCCVPDAAGTPRRETLEPDDKTEVERLEGALARIDAALGGAP